MNIAITTSYIVINNETTVNVFKDELAGTGKKSLGGRSKRASPGGGGGVLKIVTNGDMSGHDQVVTSPLCTSYMFTFRAYEAN